MSSVGSSAQKNMQQLSNENNSVALYW